MVLFIYFTHLYTHTLVVFQMRIMGEDDGDDEGDVGRRVSSLVPSARPRGSGIVVVEPLQSETSTFVIEG